MWRLPIALLLSLLTACLGSRSLVFEDLGTQTATRGAGPSAADGGQPNRSSSAEDRDPPPAGGDRDSPADAGRDAGSIEAEPDAGGADRSPSAGGRDAGAVKDAGPALQTTDPDLRVAFIGDQGNGQGAVDVLALIKAEQAHMVMHAGDFDYASNPAAWDQLITDGLGADFPYFASVGNHDVAAWPGPDGYQALLKARLARVPGAVCSGDYGVSSACSYRGLFFFLSGVGTLGSGHDPAMQAALAEDRSVFQICNWHKNQHDMQVGAKGDEVGWEAYQICQAAGALIVTGHEHSYARTLTLTDVGNEVTGHGAVGDPDRLFLQPGATAVIVSGLGGRSERVFRLDLHGDDTWWAAAHARDRQVRSGLQYAAETSIRPGALFVDFHVEGDGGRARGYFKTTDGVVVDRFDLFVLP